MPAGVPRAAGESGHFYFGETGHFYLGTTVLASDSDPLCKMGAAPPRLRARRSQSSRRSSPGSSRAAICVRPLSGPSGTRARSPSRATSSPRNPEGNRCLTVRERRRENGQGHTDKGHSVKSPGDEGLSLILDPPLAALVVESFCHQSLESSTSSVNLGKGRAPACALFGSQSPLLLSRRRFLPSQQPEEKRCRHCSPHGATAFKPRPVAVAFPFSLGRPLLRAACLPFAVEENHMSSFSTPRADRKGRSSS